MKMWRCGALLACLGVAGAGCGPVPEGGGLSAGERVTSDGGYVLFAPLLSTVTYRVDRQGRAVHTWESELAPGVAVYLLDNGHLLRAGRHPGVPFLAPGQGGRLQEFTWQGELVWDWVAADEGMVQHHDIDPLPSGHVLMLVWESKSREEAVRAGRRPELVGPGGLWPEAVLEVEPQPPGGGRVVWEWHLWDHLIQDHDPERANYAVAAPNTRTSDTEHTFSSEAQLLVGNKEYSLP